MEEKPEVSIDDYIVELGNESPNIGAFIKLVLNRLSINKLRGGRLTRKLCCRRRDLDYKIEEAKQYVKKELDVVRFIKKQRQHTNLLWSFSTPWQRAVCRSQANLLLQDKLESEYASLKLGVVRRLEDKAAWQSTESEDPLDAEHIESLQRAPSALDLKFLKRYIAVCTPEPLKVRVERKKPEQREFEPKFLPEKLRFTESKAAEILERRRKNVARSELSFASPITCDRDDESGPYTQRNRSSMKRIEFAALKNGGISALS